LNDMSEAVAKMTDSPLSMFTQGLAEADPAIDAVLKGELHRQREQIELIASENIVSRAVLEAAGSVLTNKYDAIFFILDLIIVVVMNSLSGHR